jgi:Ca2+-binding RTX toxin-like protein
MSRLTLVAVSAGVLAASSLVAVPAQAVTTTSVTIQNGVLRVQASAGAENGITLFAISSSTIEIAEWPGNALTAQSPCVPAPLDRVRCPSGGVSSFLVSALDGDDQVVTRTTLPGTVLTGDGDDVAVDNFSVAVTIALGNGDDGVKPGTGPNVVFGGPGRDLVSYKDFAAPIEVRLDDAANDGPAVRDDNIHSDVEDIIGGQGPDVLVGGDFDNTIDGRGGNDFEFGLGGNDTFTGQTGADGADVIFGGIGADTVS